MKCEIEDLKLKIESLNILVERTQTSEPFIANPQTEFPRNSQGELGPPSQDLNNVKSLTCDTCDLTFPTEKEFNSHNAFKFICDVCDICFPTKNDVKKHELDFHPGYPSANYHRTKTSL